MITTTIHKDFDLLKIADGIDVLFDRERGRSCLYLIPTAAFKGAEVLEKALVHTLEKKRKKRVVPSGTDSWGGIPTIKKEIPDEQLLEFISICKEMIETKITYKNIGDYLGVSRNSICNWTRSRKYKPYRDDDIKAIRLFIEEYQKNPSELFAKVYACKMKRERR